MTDANATIDPQDITIEPMGDLPDHLRGTTRELNMIEYRDHRIHLARVDGELYGAIRSAVRVDERRRHGFLGDLQVEPENRNQGIEKALIQAGEQRLFEREECTRIDAVMEDGEGWTRPYFRCGFWSSRKTVDMAWDLEEVAPVEIPDLPGVTVETTQQLPHGELRDFILDSYQPYWRFWKEYKQDLRWIRVEYGGGPEEPESEEIKREMRNRVEKRLRSFNSGDEQVFFLARKDGEIIAACDALDSHEGDTFEWGMLALYGTEVKNLGSALVGKALNWLAERDHEVARIKATSGLDDFAPVVYLYTAATGAKIVGEYVNCAKLVTGERPEEQAAGDVF